jgi:hypothetical protein
MYACIPTIGADFSAGCAGQRIGHLLFVTPPPPHDPRIDFCESQHHRAGNKGENGAGTVRSLPRATAILYA